MKKIKENRWLILTLGLALALALAGCADLGGEEAAPTSVPPTSTAQPPAGEGEGAQEAAAAEAKADLASRLEVDAEDIAVVSVEAKEWSDASLGCPEEGEMYAQVLTPGYQIILEVDGTRYDYRADQGGSFKLCQQ